ncbi:MAG: RnfABCDGE type electron transport complex subunit D [Lachnospiraceae bacterium]|nr:RnfABCDGE type electron transport complex subunit D [Lachnospiraceae bacterium]
MESRYKTPESLRVITANYCIALLPVIVAGCYAFGFHAFKVLLAATVSSVLSEYVYERLMKQPVTILDGTSLLTGLLLGLCLPSEVPLYVPVLGGIFATVVVVHLFGGYGFHIMNPVLVSRCFLLLSFQSVMTQYLVDGMSMATPLSIMRNGGVPNLKEMVLLNPNAGCIGEASVLALLVGALFLLVARKISLITPLVYLTVFSAFVCLFGEGTVSVNYLLSHICGGGLVFVAFFFATDRVTSPVGAPGKVVYGFLLGVITGIYRIMGTATEGVSYAVIFCNLLVPLIDKFFAPKVQPEGEEVRE